MLSKYYKILGLNKNASFVEVKSAYRKLAMKYHPDRNKSSSSEKKFKKIKEAYEVITNKNNAYSSDSDSEFSSSSYSTEEYGFEGGFDDIFSSFFKKSDNDTVNKDIVYKVTISIEHGYFGLEYSIEIPIWHLCSSCIGLKYKDSSSKTVCYSCNGTGFIKKLNSFFSLKRSCNKCSGKGYLIIDFCVKCNGLGKIQKNETVIVVIPRGITTGTKILVKDKQELIDAEQQIYCNIYLKVYLTSSKLLSIDKHLDLHYNFNISLIDSILGSFSSFRIFNEVINFSIPSCTKDRSVILKSNKGYYISKTNSRSNLYIHICYVYPVTLTVKQKKLFRKLKELF